MALFSIHGKVSIVSDETIIKLFITLSRWSQVENLKIF